jgi:hypothetical protein
LVSLYFTELDISILYFTFFFSPSLDDEMFEVREEAQTQWLAAGEQFLNENEDSFKKQVDYLPDTLLPDYSLNGKKRQ